MTLHLTRGSGVKSYSDPRACAATGSNLLLFPLLLVLAVTVASACASSSTVGVRAHYQNVAVDTIALVPFYTLGTLSLGESEREQMLHSYEHATRRLLEQMGFSVIDSRAFQHQLVEVGVWQEFRDGVLLRESLTSYFEPAQASDAAASVEVATLARMTKAGVLPTPYLMFGEVLYHSQGTCHVDARRFNEYARTHVMPSAPSELPRPCVVSHFHAKLVDAGSGQTMWYNRFMREVHTGSVDDAIATENVHTTIFETFGAAAGLGRFLPGERIGDDGVQMHVETEPR